MLTLMQHAHKEIYKVMCNTHQYIRYSNCTVTPILKILEVENFGKSMLIHQIFQPTKLREYSMTKVFAKILST